MEKHQIVEVAEKSNHAGKKAPADVAVIAERLGYKQHFVSMNTSESGTVAKLQRQFGYQKDWRNCYNDIPEGSIVLLQNPFHNQQLTRNSILKKLKEKKKVRFISLIHDVEELRGTVYDSYYKSEFELMLSLSEVFIVHNKVMKDFFIRKGVSEDRIVVLEIFDYLHSFEMKLPEFSKTVSIAGNLDVYKCQYVGQLARLSNISFKLYGNNFNEEMRKYGHIKYCGSFPVDEIPEQLDTGFGLVWDGESIETCKGPTGQYLRYNNPHKLSLYLSSGLPVVIWSEAAEAGFVRENGVGICVDSLEQLPEIINSLDKNKYLEMAKNVHEISKRLVEGYYTSAAINKAESLILRQGH